MDLRPANPAFTRNHHFLTKVALLPVPSALAAILPRVEEIVREAGEIALEFFRHGDPTHAEDKPQGWWFAGHRGRSAHRPFSARPTRTFGAGPRLAVGRNRGFAGPSCARGLVRCRSDRWHARFRRRRSLFCPVRRAGGRRPPGLRHRPRPGAGADLHRHTGRRRDLQWRGNRRLGPENP